MMTLDIVDVLIQNKYYLTLEPLYTNIEAVRLYVDRDDKLKVLGTNNFMCGYFDYISIVFNNNNNISKLFYLISNISGINVFTNKLLINIVKTPSQINYTRLDPIIFVYMFEYANKSPSYLEVFKYLCEIIYDMKGTTNEDNEGENRMKFCNSIISKFVDNNKSVEFIKFLKCPCLVSNCYIYNLTTLNEKIAPIIVEFSQNFDNSSCDWLYECEEVKLFVKKTIKIYKQPLDIK